MYVKDILGIEKQFYTEMDYRDMTAKCNVQSRLDRLSIKGIFRTTGEG